MNVGDEVYFGHYKVSVEEVQEDLDRALVDVKTQKVDWEGYVNMDFLTEEKSSEVHNAGYPWPEDD